MAPRYISDLARKKAALFCSLRSNDLALSDVPRTRFKIFDDRVFAYAAAHRHGRNFLSLLEWPRKKPFLMLNVGLTGHR